MEVNIQRPGFKTLTDAEIEEIEMKQAKNDSQSNEILALIRT